MKIESGRLIRTGLAIIGLAALLLLVRGGPPPSGPAEADGLAARDVEKAKRLAQALTRLKQSRAARLQAVESAAGQGDPEQEVALLRALRDPVDIKRALLGDKDARWSATVLRLEDLTFAKEARRECGAVLGGEIQELCNYRIDMAVERRDARTGVIRRVKSAVTDSDAEPVCEAFADCIAFARLGLEIPLPEEDRHIYGIGQRLQSTPLKQEMRDPQFVDQQIAAVRVGVDAFASKVDPDDPIAMHQLRSIRGTLAYLESWSAELKAKAR